MPRRKSAKLKQLEDKLKAVKKELSRRKKLAASVPSHSSSNSQHNGGIKTSPVNKSSSTNKSSSKRRSKSSKTPLEECQALLERIRKIQYSKAFLEPVDWKQLNIPTYRQIIKRPMDLSTIQHKLNTNQYTRPYEFASDMRLVYQNACTFNKHNTPYFLAATKFAKKFEEEFERRLVDTHESNNFTRSIHKVISSLIKRDEASAFRMPVNPQVLEIPDYHDVITSPIDLGSILNRIHSYTSFPSFVSDLLLVWENCCRYNPKQNQIHQTALRLRELSQKQLQRYCPDDFAHWQDSSMSPHSTHPEHPSSSLSMHHTLAAPQNTLSLTNKHNAIAPGPSGARLGSSQSSSSASSDNEADSQPRGLYAEPAAEPEDGEDAEDEADKSIFARVDALDEEEGNKVMIAHLVCKDKLDGESVAQLDFVQKEELQRGIECLDSDHLEPLITMLHGFLPPDEDGADGEVELDSIDDSLQVKMYNYLLRALQQQESERCKREGVERREQVEEVGGIAKEMEEDAMEVEEEEEEEEEEEVEEEMEVREESPNVVTAFPTSATGSAGFSMSVEAVEGEGAAEDVEMTEDKKDDKEDELLEDIAKVVVTENVEKVSEEVMPVLEEEKHEGEPVSEEVSKEAEEVGKEVTDEGGEEKVAEVKETLEYVVREDGLVEEDGNEQNEEEVVVEEKTMGLGREEVTAEEEAADDVEVDDDAETNVTGESMSMEEGDDDAQNNVDTPLADDIDF